MTAPDLPAMKALLARVEAADSELPRGEAIALVLACGFDADATYLLTVALTDGPLNATGYALAFFEAVLPGWGWMKYTDGSVGIGGGNAWLEQNKPLANLALTIIAATLKAKIAEGESENVNN